MCVELNQLRPVSSTDVGAGQPEGTVAVGDADDDDDDDAVVVVAVVSGIMLDVAVVLLELVIDDDRHPLS